MEDWKKRCKYGWLLTETELRTTSREWDWGKVKIRREQRKCQEAEIQKYREIEREKKKNKCKPPRINSLISLWGRMEKKEDFHLLSSQAPFDISLFLSHILISLVSIHHAGTLVELAKALAHMANLAGHKSLSVALFLPLFFSSLLLGNFTWSFHFSLLPLCIICFLIMLLDSRGLEAGISSFHLPLCSPFATVWQLCNCCTGPITHNSTHCCGRFNEHC